MPQGYLAPQSQAAQSCKSAPASRPDAAHKGGHANRHLEHQRRQGAARACWTGCGNGPDVVCLQEIKSVDEAFPARAIEELGYNVAVHGQKGFNGVAILSKRPFEDVRAGLPGDDGDEQARYIEALVPRAGGVVRVGILYLPNGNPIGTDKFAYKLAWMERLQARTPRAARAGGAAGAARRLQRHPRADRRQEPGGLA